VARFFSCTLTLALSLWERGLATARNDRALSLWERGLATARNDRALSLWA